MSGYDYFNQPPIFDESLGLPAKMRKFLTGGSFFTTVGDTSEQEFQEQPDVANRIRVKGGTLRDSSVEIERRAQKQEEQLRTEVADHSVYVKRLNDDSAEVERLMDDMLKTAASVAEMPEAAKSAAGRQPNMITLDIPRELKVAAQIQKAVINKNTNSLFIKSAAVGQGMSIYMKLLPNAHDNTASLIIKAADKGWPDDVAAALAQHLRTTAFAQIEALYDTGES